jgi:DNA-binding MarR family transcriptional regulator
MLSIGYGLPVPPPVNPEDAWTRFAMGVFKVNGLIIRAGEGITNPVGQSSARWQVLGRAYEPTTVAKIAQDIGHARQSVQRIADILAAEGLVSYEDNPTDRRARLLQLTSDGAEVLEKIYQRQVEWSLRIMQRLSPAQLVRIANGLEGIAQVLESSLDADRETGRYSAEPAAQ